MGCTTEVNIVCFWLFRRNFPSRHAGASRATDECQSHDSRYRNFPFLHLTTFCNSYVGICTFVVLRRISRPASLNKEFKLATRLSSMSSFGQQKATVSASSVIFKVLEKVTMAFKKGMFAGGKSIYYEVRILIACDRRMHLIGLSRCSICTHPEPCISQSGSFLKTLYIVPHHRLYIMTVGYGFRRPGVL